jgi:hypothetical protein
MSNPVIRRSEMLRLVGIGARQFDAMLHRDQLPWPKREASRSWAEFSTDDAFRLAITWALVGMGQSYDDATNLVRVNYELVSKRRGKVGEDLFFGVFLTRLKSEDEAVRTHLAVAAPWSELPSEMARLRDLVSSGEPIIAHTFVNATETMRDLLANADREGLVDRSLKTLARKVGAL